VILRSGGTTLSAARESSLISEDDVETTFPIGERGSLYLRGRALPESDRRVLGAFLTQIDAALRQRELSAEAESMRPVAEADRLRTALLAAVGHDLRRPLAAATAAITSLRSAEVELSAEDRRELLEAAEESLDALADLVTKLLDASRLQAGVLGVTPGPVALDAVVSGTLDELGLAPGEVRLELSEVPLVQADAVLLQRAVVNVLANALRFSPTGVAPVIASSRFADRVQLRIIDEGPGIPEERREDVFVAFQRLGDTDNTTGVGLGLALSKGFVEAMGGTLTAEDTPGGGLTLVIELAAVA
jgi:two-component system sensor histidine kinase KdpD